MQNPQKRKRSTGLALVHNIGRLWRYTDGHVCGFLSQQSRRAMEALVLIPFGSVLAMVLIHGLKSMGGLGGIVIALSSPVVVLGSGIVRAIQEMKGDRKATWFSEGPGAAAA